MTKAKEVIKYDITDAALAELKKRLAGTDASTDYDAAKTAIKECTSLRTSLETKRVALKADALDYGRRVDSEAKRIRLAIEAVEDPIKETKETVDTAAKQLEASRVADIRVRIGEIQGLGLNLIDTDGSIDVADIQAKLARLMTIVVDESFAECFHEANSEHQQAQTNLQLALKAGQDAAARAAEQEVTRKAQEAEDARLETVRKEQEAEAEKLRAAQEQIDTQNKEIADEQERKRKEAEDAEAEKVRKAEAEKEAAAALEAREMADKEAADRAARLLPDTEKLSHLADAIEFFELPDVKSDEAQFVIAETRDSLFTVAAEVRRSTKELA